MLKSTTTRFQNLPAEMLRTWAEFQRENPDLHSPFFHPRFAGAVAHCRQDVRVCVLEDERGVAGYFPFQQRKGSRIEPLASPVSDYHGFIARPGLNVQLHQLQPAAARFDYDHLVLRQASAFGGDCQVAFSPYLDLTAGFETLEQEVNRRTSRLKGFRRKQRKLTREHGELRFEFHSDSQDVFDAMITWKSAQYRRTGVRDIFNSDRWTVALLQELMSLQEGSLRGVLSALYAGDRLVAAHFGMMSGTLMHWWFPVYDPAYALYSPGALLLLEVAAAAAAHGVTTLDLGKGDEGYKATLCSGQMLLAEGSTAPRSPQVVAGRCFRASRKWLKATPIGAALVAARNAGYAMLGRWSQR